MKRTILSICLLALNIAPSFSQDSQSLLSELGKGNNSIFAKFDHEYFEAVTGLNCREQIEKSKISNLVFDSKEVSAEDEDITVFHFPKVTIGSATYHLDRDSNNLAFFCEAQGMSLAGVEVGPHKRLNRKVKTILLDSSSLRPLSVSLYASSRRKVVKSLSCLNPSVTERDLKISTRKKLVALEKEKQLAETSKKQQEEEELKEVVLKKEADRLLKLSKRQEHFALLLNDLKIPLVLHLPSKLLPVTMMLDEKEVVVQDEKKEVILPIDERLHLHEPCVGAGCPIQHFLKGASLHHGDVVKINGNPYPYVVLALFQEKALVDKGTTPQWDKHEEEDKQIIAIEELTVPAVKKTRPIPAQKSGTEEQQVASLTKTVEHMNEISELELELKKWNEDDARFFRIALKNPSENINKTHGPLKWSIAHFATDYNSPNILRWFLKNGGDVNTRKQMTGKKYLPNGRPAYITPHDSTYTALMFSLLNRNYEITKILLGHPKTNLDNLSGLMTYKQLIQNPAYSTPEAKDLEHLFRD